MAVHAGTHVTKTVRLLELMSEGGMGSVWVAEHLGLDTRVAVKFILPELIAADEGDALGRFRREAAAAAKIKSPHVVHMLDFGVMDDGTPFIVMELLEGESLADRMDRERLLPWRSVLEILGQSAKALDHAHALNIVHRDIKPDNIFLQRVHDEEIVKLLDFGVAKHPRAGGATKLTQTGAFLGTPAYMSPEQVVAARDVDHRADHWAIAVIAYESLLGRLPFDAETLGALIVEITSFRYTPPSELGVGSQLDGWFSRAFAPNPEARFASAKEMVAELARCLASLEAESVSMGATLPLAAEESTPTVPTATRGHKTAPATDPIPEVALPSVPSGSAGPTQQSEVGAHLESLHPVEQVSAGDARTFSGAASRVPSQPPVSTTRQALVWVAGGLIAVAAAAIIWSSSRSDPPRILLAEMADSLPAIEPPPTEPESPAGMVVVPAGRYTIGCPDEALSQCFDDEKPSHTMELPAFGIMEHEVTVGEYRRCVAADHCKAPERGGDCSWGLSDDALPVSCVSWQDARRYCAYEGWRLPTEQEWEAAARGPDGGSFPWGDAAPSCTLGAFAGTEEGCAREGPVPVGTQVKDVSVFGALDMGGNLREWTASGYEAYPGGQVEAGVEGKVNRGGSWMMTPERSNTSHTRVVDDPAERRPDLGFRCATEVTP